MIPASQSETTVQFVDSDSVGGCEHSGGTVRGSIQESHGHVDVRDAEVDIERRGDKQRR